MYILLDVAQKILVKWEKFSHQSLFEQYNDNILQIWIIYKIKILKKKQAGLSCSVPPLQGTNTKYQYQIPIQDTNTKYQYQIPIPDTNTKYQYQVPIPNTNTKYQYQIPIPDTNTKYQYQVPIPNTNTRYQYQILRPEENICTLVSVL